MGTDWLIASNSLSDASDTSLRSVCPGASQRTLLTITSSSRFPPIVASRPTFRLSNWPSLVRPMTIAETCAGPNEFSMTKLAGTQ